MDAYSFVRAVQRSVRSGMSQEDVIEGGDGAVDARINNMTNLELLEEIGYALSDIVNNLDR